MLNPNLGIQIGKCLTLTPWHGIEKSEWNFLTQKSETKVTFFSDF
jgi:hypothetical protein